MRVPTFSQYLVSTLRHVSADATVASHRLLLQSGFVVKNGVGLYTFSGLAQRALRKVETIIDEEMHSIGCCRISMPGLTEAGLWKETGRWDEAGEELFRLRDRKGQDYCMGATHEETVTDVARQVLHSYRQLPVRLYQVGPKWRDEVRPRHGVLRGREFLMKDLYTFDEDEDAAERTYGEVRQAYVRICRRLGLHSAVLVPAEGGLMGGSWTEEVLVPCAAGEDRMGGDDGGEEVPVLEIGHLFRLGTKYSAAMGACFADAGGGQPRPLHMGCFGLGVSRLLGALAEVYHQELSGALSLRWPLSAAPFRAALLPLGGADPQQALRVAQRVLGHGEVLLDDRQGLSVGVRLRDAELLGFPVVLVVSPRNDEAGVVEVRVRWPHSQSHLVPREQLEDSLRSLLDAMQ